MNAVFQNRRICPRTYQFRYNAARGGHAPEHLRSALIDALESAVCDGGTCWDALQIEFYDPANQLWWDGATPRKRAAWLIGQLWNSTDIVSGVGVVCSYLDLPGRRTIGRMVRLLKRQLIESDL
jgi:hypothetical protein